VDERMLGVVGPQHPFRQIGRIPWIQLLDGHDRQQIVHRVAQRDVSANPQSRISRNRQRHWDWKERPVGKPHLMQHTAEVSFAHESIERREPAGRQQLQVADHAR
jgi:hypothetical protein